MRLSLGILAAVLAAAIFAPSARAQASIPYRRTIPILLDRPHRYTGRYVRIGVSGGPPLTSRFGGSTNSITLQAIIVPSGGVTLTNGGSSVGDGDDRKRK